MKSFTASILGLAATTGTVAQGGGLLAVYSAGLAVPFLITAIAFNRATTAFGWVKRSHFNGMISITPSEPCASSARCP